MIVFDLQCRDGGETFEAWFRSNADFDEQRAGGLVHCPGCGSGNVEKAPMAPCVPRKGSTGALDRLAAMQADLLRQSRWVGDEFADTARAIHCGDLPPEQVHGSTSVNEAKSLIDEGVPVLPLPLPVTPSNQLN